MKLSKLDVKDWAKDRIKGVFGVAVCIEKFIRID